MTLKDIRPALRGFLLDDGDIVAVVEDRVFPTVLPQGIRTASIVYNHVSGAGDYHTKGPSGLASPRIQVDVWAPSADAAMALANLVKARIDGYRGPMQFGTDSPQSSVTVQGIFQDNHRDDYNDEMKMFLVSRDYFIWFEEN